MTNSVSTFAAVAMAVVAQGASAQGQASAPIADKSLYLACTLQGLGDPERQLQLHLAYLQLRGTGDFQIQVHDPHLLIADRPSEPKAKIALSRLTSDRRLFLWFGRPVSGTSGEVDAMVEATPSGDNPNRAAISITRFKAEADSVIAQKYTGECDTLSGKKAREEFQRNQPQ